MKAKSTIVWPDTMCFQGIATWAEQSSAARNPNASGERAAMLVQMDGSEIDQVEAHVLAGTAASGINCYFLGVAGGDTQNVTALPDDNNIIGSTGKVFNKGGSAETLIFSFSSPKPAPTGANWLVFEPTGGTFDIVFPYTEDWKNSDGTSVFRDGAHKHCLYDNIDWNNVNTGGPGCLRIKKSDASYYTRIAYNFPPINLTDHTISNADRAENTDVIGAKFIAPFNGDLRAIRWKVNNMSTYLLAETVLIDSSNNVLQRGLGPAYYWDRNSTPLVYLPTGWVLTKGDTYRVYLSNPTENTDFVDLFTVTLTGENEKDYFGLSGNELIFTSATDPPSEGGTGSWTDSSLKLPFFNLYFEMDPADLEGDPPASSSAIPQRARLGAS